MRMLGSGVPAVNVRKIFDNISFVVFNYDRCIEFFLPHALQKLYGIQPREASEIRDRLSIIHPYGVIPLEVSFGYSQANCVALANDIKTYTERMGDTEVVDAIVDQVQRAEQIVFLGFAYHDQNMSLFKPTTAMPPSKRLFGTAYQMSDSDVEVVGHQIDSWFEHNDARAYRTSMIRIENKMKCTELFDYYTKSLTGS